MKDYSRYALGVAKEADEVATDNQDCYPDVPLDTTDQLRNAARTIRELVRMLEEKK